MLREIEILLNGKKEMIPAGSTVEDLIRQLGLKRDQVAVELNREIVRRDSWAECLIAERDAVEIVHFVGGGVDKR